LIYLHNSAVTLLLRGRLHRCSIAFLDFEGLNWSRVGLHFHYCGWKFLCPRALLFELIAMKNSSFLLASSCDSTYDVTSLTASVVPAADPPMLCLLTFVVF
jgi:hypothetical protein